MKVRIAKFAFSAALLVAMMLLGLNIGRASCSFHDDDYGYQLICIGDAGSCKFINPTGQFVICTGNQAEAIPDIEDQL